MLLLVPLKLWDLSAKPGVFSVKSGIEEEELDDDDLEDDEDDEDEEDDEDDEEEDESLRLCVCALCDIESCNCREKGDGVFGVRSKSSPQSSPWSSGLAFIPHNDEIILLSSLISSSSTING